MVTVTEGEEVKIRTSGGEIDPNTYKVEFIKRDLVGLTCKETGILIKVNNQRILKIIKQEEKKMNKIESAVIDIETGRLTRPEQETSEIVVEETIETQESPETPTEESTVLNLDQLVQDGFEVWTKNGLSLGTDPKVSTINVAAHCVIDPEDTPNRGYEIFNSYNGSRGKKGKVGKRYAFTDKMTVEKKRLALEKKGYTLHTI